MSKTKYREARCEGGWINMDAYLYPSEVEVKTTFGSFSLKQKGANFVFSCEEGNVDIFIYPNKEFVVNQSWRCYTVFKAPLTTLTYLKLDGKVLLSPIK